MEGGQLDLEESRRILEEDGDDGEQEDGDAEEGDAESIQKLSSFTFHPEKKERGESSMGLTKSPTRTLTRGARLISHMDDDDEDFEDDGKEDSIIRDNEESDEEFGVSKRVRAGRPFSTSRYPNNDDNDDDDDDDDDEEDDNDDDNDVEAPPLEGVYDPREFDHLTVDPEVTPQNCSFNPSEKGAGSVWVYHQAPSSDNNPRLQAETVHS